MRWISFFWNSPNYERNGSLQSKRNTHRASSLTLHKTHCVHTSMNEIYFLNTNWYFWVYTLALHLPNVVPCTVVDVSVCELLTVFQGGCMGAGTDVSTVTGGTWAVTEENPDVPGAATGVGPDIEVNCCCMDDWNCVGTLLGGATGCGAPGCWRVCRPWSPWKPWLVCCIWDCMGPEGCRFAIPGGGRFTVVRGDWLKPCIELCCDGAWVLWPPMTRRPELPTLRFIKGGGMFIPPGLGWLKPWNRQWWTNGTLPHSRKEHIGLDSHHSTWSVSRCPLPWQT